MEKGKNKPAILLALLSFVPTLHILVNYLNPELLNTPFKHLVILYAIIGGFTLAHLVSIKSLLNRWPKQAGMVIAALNFLKMLLCLVILITMIFPILGKSISLALQFTAIYFYFLVIESVLLIHFLIPRNQK